MTAAADRLRSRFAVLSGDPAHPSAEAAPITLAASACTNCGSGPVGNYCAACGQRPISARDLTVGGFIREAIAELTSFDGRLALTLRTLLTRPGMLGREFFAGRGGRYMKPLSLFLLLNVLFFIIQPHTGLLQYSLDNYVGYDGDVARAREDEMNAARLHQAVERRSATWRPGPVVRPLEAEPYEVFEQRFDATLADQKKSMLLFSIPVLALCMVPLYAGRRRTYAEHLVFSMHTYAFFLFFAGVCVTPLFRGLFLVGRFTGIPPAMIGAMFGGETALSFVLLAVIGGYTSRGLQRMYGDSEIPALLRAGAIFACLELLIIVYHRLLFVTTLASL